MSITPVIRTFADADAWLAASRSDPDDRTAYVKSTRVQRRGPDSIALRYHETDVVTYHRDGSTSLATGGWLTNTTLARIDGFTPWRISRNGGRWWLATHTREYGSEYGQPYTAPDWTDVVAFRDGITVHADGSITGAENPAVVAAEDAHNAKVRKIVTRAFKAQRKHGAISVDGQDCGPCRLIIAGIPVTSTDHIYLHLADLQVSSVGTDALRAANVMAGNSRIVEYYYVNERYLRRYERYLRRYFIGQLYVGATSHSPNGRKPIAGLPSWQSAA